MHLHNLFRFTVYLSVTNVTNIREIYQFKPE